VDVDAVEFILDDLLQTTLIFGYYHAQGDVPTDQSGVTNFNEAGFAFALSVFGVFEFVDNNGQPGFQNGTTDEITGYYDLTSIFLEWQPMEIDSSNVTVNGTTFQIFIITIQTLDEVFLLRFVAVGYPSEVEGIKISPTSVKVDFEINWFNNDLFTGATAWSTGPSTVANAQVGAALVFAAEAGEVSTTPASGNTKPGLQFDAGDYIGYFEWEPQANVTVDGVEAEYGVVGTIETTSNTSMNASFAFDWVVSAGYFTFDAIRPTTVAWDPEFGTELVTVDTNSSFAVKIDASLTFYIAILVVVMMFINL